MTVKIFKVHLNLKKRYLYIHEKIIFINVVLKNHWFSHFPIIISITF